MVDRVAVIEAEENAAVPYDASDAEQVHEARKKAGRRKSWRLDFVRRVMSEEDGRRWINELLEECDMWGSPLVVGDTHLTYHNLGRQNFGKKIFLDVLAAAPDEYLLMMSEAKNK